MRDVYNIPGVRTGALNFAGRSPFSVRSAIGVPPAYAPAPDVQFKSGTPVVGGIPLATSGKTAQEYLFNPPSDPDAVKPIPSYNAGQYGEEGQITINLLAGIPQIALRRPAKKRIQLTIQNQNAVGNVGYNFDNSPSTNGSVLIAAGGNRQWDTVVPQGDLWLISAVNAVVQIEFINLDITAAA
jgi:hypothetical protein